MSDLITIEEARRRVLTTVTRLGDEPMALDAALGRVLAEEVSSTLPVPPFDSSAMDGFAVVAGQAAELSVVGEARAGHPLLRPASSRARRCGFPRGLSCPRAPMPWFLWSERRR